MITKNKQYFAYYFKYDVVTLVKILPIISPFCDRCKYHSTNLMLSSKTTDNDALQIL